MADLVEGTFARGLKLREVVGLPVGLGWNGCEGIPAPCPDGVPSGAPRMAICGI